MSNRTTASTLRWLTCCAICLSTLDLRAQEPKQFVVIETWVATIDFPKLRSLNFTWDQVGADGQIRTIKIVDVLEGRVDDAEIVQRPEEFLKLLQRAGVARVLAEPKVVTVSGSKAMLEIGAANDGVRIEATPLANAKGQIRLAFRAEISEPLPGPSGLKALFNTDPAGMKVSQLAFKKETESGLVTLDSSHCRAMPNSVSPLPIVLVRATLEKSDSLAPIAETANATYREIR